MLFFSSHPLCSSQETPSSSCNGSDAATKKRRNSLIHGQIENYGPPPLLERNSTQEFLKLFLDDNTCEVSYMVPDQDIGDDDNVTMNPYNIFPMPPMQQNALTYQDPSLKATPPPPPPMQQYALTYRDPSLKATPPPPPPMEQYALLYHDLSHMATYSPTPRPTPTSIPTPVPTNRPTPTPIPSPMPPSQRPTPIPAPQPSADVTISSTINKDQESTNQDLVTVDESNIQDLDYADDRLIIGTTRDNCYQVYCLVSDIAPVHNKNSEARRPILNVSHDTVFNAMTFMPSIDGNPSSLSMCGKHIPQDFIDAMPKIKEVLFEDFPQGNYNTLPSRIQIHLRTLSRYRRIDITDKIVFLCDMLHYEADSISKMLCYDSGPT